MILLCQQERENKMITSKMVPNPNYRPGSRLPVMVRQTACSCGATNLIKRYQMINGEVEGLVYACRVCD